MDSKTDKKISLNNDEYSRIIQSIRCSSCELLVQAPARHYCTGCILLLLNKFQMQSDRLMFIGHLSSDKTKINTRELDFTPNYLRIIVALNNRHDRLLRNVKADVCIISSANIMFDINSSSSIHIVLKMQPLQFWFKVA